MTIAPVQTDTLFPIIGLFSFSDVSFLPNVHIGDHTIIGAGSIVVHSTPPDSIVTGIAAKAKTHSKN